MMFAVPTEEYVVNPVLERAVDRIFHFARRPRTKRFDFNRAFVRSSGTSPYAAAARQVWRVCGGLRMVARMKHA